MRPFMEAIDDLTQLIADPADVDGLVRRLVDLTMQVTSAICVEIVLGSQVDSAWPRAETSGNEARPRILPSGPLESGNCCRHLTVQQTIRGHGMGTSPTAETSELPIRFAQTLNLPLTAHGQVIGMLLAYRASAADWTDDDIEACEVLASVGGGYILHAQQLLATRRLTEQLQEALASRGIIERAKGMLMAEHQIDADAAFHRLAHASMRTNRKLRDVASDVAQPDGPR